MLLILSKATLLNNTEVIYAPYTSDDALFRKLEFKKKRKKS